MLGPLLGVGLGFCVRLQLATTRAPIQYSNSLKFKPLFQGGVTPGSSLTEDVDLENLVCTEPGRLVR